MNVRDHFAIIEEVTRFHNEHIEHRRLTATQILKERTMGQVHFSVPAKDIIAEWTERREKFQEDLRQEVATVDKIRQLSASADTACNDGKVHSLRRQIRLLELQLRFIDPEETFTMTEEGLQNTFESFAHIGGLGQVAATERRY